MMTTVNPTTEAVPTKVCSLCWQRLPITRFRRRVAGGEERHSECRSCRLAHDAETRRLARTRTVDLHAQEVNRHKHDPIRLLALVDEVVRHFGGPERFAEVYVEAMSEARRRRKTALSTRLLLAVLAMQDTGRAAVDSSEYLSTVDDDDLRLEFHRHVRDAVRENPHLAIQAVQELGWTVIPPAEPAP